jgi:hypothetical protein
MSSAGPLTVHGLSPKKEQGESILKHPQDLNLLTSAIKMDDATRKLIQGCARVSATPITAMRLDHLVTGEKYSDKQIEHILEQAKGVVCSEYIIHPDKITANNLFGNP